MQTHDRETDTYETVRGPHQWTFTYEGEKQSDNVFTFAYSVEDAPHWTNQDMAAQVRSLAAAAQYRTYTLGYSGYSLLHADLPVTVTLYGADGAPLDTLELTIDTYDVRTW